MVDRGTPGRSNGRLFVLDTNVLIHDPTAIFCFEEHDIFLPMAMLEELDASKKGMSEAARNARQASRFLDTLLQGRSKKEIDRGIRLEAPPDNGLGAGRRPTGHLFFQTRSLTDALPPTLPGNRPDNNILAHALALQKERPEATVILVTKDINLRIKAAVLGSHAEDYFNDKSLTDSDVLYSGVEALPGDFWESHGKKMESWQEDGRAFYRLQGPRVAAWHPKQFLYVPGENGFQAMVRRIEDEAAIVETVKDYRSEKNAVWGIRARNREQNFALNLLLDNQVDLVTILGAAGTGKTLLTLAAGLTQMLDEKRYIEIIMTRVTVPLGEDIGFLPGSEEEKMEPWMGALMDNLEVLARTDEGDAWGRAATNDLLRNRIKIRSLNFMRGRTFLNRFIILDEAQNLTPKQMKALITRAGPGTKLVCLGNVEQIDTPYLTETSSGLTFVVDRFRSWGHAGHVTLVRGERSRLAHYASDIL